jgi:putative transposase
MARPLRPLVPNGVYHVMSRGNRREAIFGGDGDRLLFLDLLRQVAGRRAWSVHAYCLMTTHYHLVVETPNADLSFGMQVLNGEYAQWFNRCHGLVGHLFQGRFKAILVESEWHFLELYRYVALNPVRAGRCDDPSAWPWSSYPLVLAGDASHLVSGRRVLAHFGADRTRACERLRRFVEGHASSAQPSAADMSGSDPDIAGWATA